MDTRIREAALKLFAMKGYENTTMREIGNEVGIRGSSIYAHYKSKEEIFLSVVNDLFGKIMQKDVYPKSIADKNNDLKSVLFKTFKNYYIFFSQHEEELLLWQRIRFFTPPGMEGKYDTNYLLYDRPIAEIYFELFEKGVNSKQLKIMDVGMLVMSFFSFISGFTDSLIIVPFRLSEQQIHSCFEVFWDGIRQK